MDNSNLKTFPINLQLGGRKCLIVGGGKVASRKIDKLLDSGSDITVICTKPSQKIKELGDSGAINLINRNFYLDDILGFFLVYASTNDRALNDKILDACHKHNILCCAVDVNWKKGTFITPASFHNEGVTVSIASGGKSCSYTKHIKNHLKKHNRKIREIDLMVIGTDHRCLSTNKREFFHNLCNNSIIKDMLNNILGIHEFMLINTCNRVELIAIASTDEITKKLVLKILNFDSLDESKYYVKYSTEAFRHLSFLAAGIYSQLIGENHITYQIKQAIDNSDELNIAGSMLKNCIDASLAIAKKIRNNTASIIKPKEIEDLTILYINEYLSQPKQLNIAVIGTGNIGKLIINKLKQANANILWFYHSRKPSEDDITLFKITDLNEYSNKVDILISAVSSDSPIITKKNSFNNLIKAIDLGIPRNISQDFSDNTINIDDLKYWYRKNICSIETIIDICEKIFKENQNSYEKIFNNFKNWSQRQQFIKTSV
ncbi:MAG TPA: NAD(P)-dependent oxidoreductase [Victivallales bacterium]|nr:NAD(P)-dependent oxidoreductase [Victivallales bacterium]